MALLASCSVTKWVLQQFGMVSELQRGMRLFISNYDCLSSHTPREVNCSELAGDHCWKGANATTELWPPKPKELEIAAVTLCSCFVLGTVFMADTSSTRFSCKTQARVVGGQLCCGSKKFQPCNWPHLVERRVQPASLNGLEAGNGLHATSRA